MAQERGGIAPDAGRTTVGEYLGLWLEDSVRTSVKPVTYEGYRQLVRKHLVPSLGRNKLGNLTPEKVRRMRGAKLAEGLSTRTVQYLLVVLRKALQQAMEDGLIPRNAAQGVRVSQNKEEIRPLSPEQAKVLLAAAGGTRLEALYVLAVHTGLRQGELFGLRWADVDFGAGTLSVKRILSGALKALNYYADDAIKRTKAWPGGPQLLSRKMRRLAPALRSAGIEYLEEEQGHRKRKVKTLKRPLRDYERSEKSAEENREDGAAANARTPEGEEPLTGNPFDFDFDFGGDSVGNPFASDDNEGDNPEGQGEERES